MEAFIDKLPNPQNIVGWVIFLASNLAFIKYQIKNLISEQKEIKEHLQDQKTSIAVIKEQVASVKGKIENGLSSQVRDTCERVARIEGACKRCHDE